MLILLALAGAAVGLGIVRIGGFGPKEFSDTGEFRLWQFLIATQTATWTIGAVILLRVLETLRGLWPRGRRAVVVTVLVAALPLVGFIVAVALRSFVTDPLPGHRWKFFLLQASGTAIALLGVAEFALVKVGLQRQPTGGTSADVARYLELRRLLQRVLAVEGAILAVAVLAAGALRNAVIASTGDASSYPREYIFIVGAYYTLVLALLYGPVYGKLVDVGHANLDAACPRVEPASLEWLATQEKRDALGKYLQLDVTASDSFRAGIAILAPLASALVALLLGTT